MRIDGPHLTRPTQDESSTQRASRPKVLRDDQHVKRTTAPTADSTTSSRLSQLQGALRTTPAERTTDIDLIKGKIASGHYFTQQAAEDTANAILNEIFGTNDSL